MGKAIKAVAEKIANHVGIDLKPSTWHPILRPLKQMIIQVRYIRFKSIDCSDRSRTSQ